MPLDINLIVMKIFFFLFHHVDFVTTNWSVIINLE